MFETPKSPHRPQSVVSETIDLTLERAKRQRQRDHDGRPDRVAELSADITALVQRSTWSLTVEQAEVIADAIDPLDGEGIRISGDHRPRMLALRAITM